MLDGQRSNDRLLIEIFSPFVILNESGLFFYLLSRALLITVLLFKSETKERKKLLCTVFTETERK